MTMLDRAAMLRLAAALVLVPAAARAQDFTATLTQAYTTNRLLQIARSQLAATDEQVALALAAKRPTISAYALGGRNLYGVLPYSRRDATAAQEDFRYDQRGAGLTITQPIYKGGGLDAGLRAAEERVKAGRATLLRTEQQVLMAAASAYLDIWLDKRLVAVETANQRDLTRQMTANTLRFRRHDITVTDLGQTRSRLAQAVSDRVAAENALADARGNYVVVVGSEPRAIGGLPDIKGLPSTLTQAVTLALANPAVVAAVHTEKAQEAVVDQQAAAWKPSLGVTYQAQRDRGIAEGVDRLDQESLLADLNVPIYQGGAVGARVRAARDQAHQAASDVDVSRRDVAKAAADAWAGLRSATRSVAAYRAQVAAAELARKGVDVEAARGSLTVLDQLNARQELKTARAALDRAERDRVVAALKVLAATGQLTARHLGLPVRLYRPAVHYDKSRSRLLDEEWPR